MRFSFVQGKQKELINYYRLKKGLTWKELCDEIGLKYGRLKAYFDETSLIDEATYKKLDPQGIFSNFLLDKKEDNWGKIKGGLNSKGSTKKINKSLDYCKLAEFFGILLGDGNSHKTKYYNKENDKRGVFIIRIIGNSNLDKDYLLEYVRPLVKELFNLNTRIYFSKNRRFMFIEANSCELVSFLESMGFPPGDKIKNKLRIPFWIRDNEDYLKLCLRGLYDTDGSIYKLTNQNSHQICFTNKNSFLLGDVRNSLLRLDINCSKISKEKDIYITRKSELRKFLKLISFNNSRHLKKVKMWNLNSPVV